MQTFAQISEKSLDTDLVKIYKNFQRLIDFVKNREIFEENADFYNEKIWEINAKISQDFHEKYNKESKKIIIEKYNESISFLADKHNLHTKNKFMVIFMMMGMFGVMSLGVIFTKENPQFFVIGQGFAMFGMMIGIIIDSKIQKENRQITITLNDAIQEK